MMTANYRRCRSAPSAVICSSSRLLSQHMSSTKATSVVIGLFWDVENCSIPKGCDAFDIAQRIRERLTQGKQEVHFSTYCNVTTLSYAHQQGLTHAKVKMPHIIGKPGAADRALLLDIDQFIHTYKSPATIVIISGDIDFVQKIHQLRHLQGYEVIVIYNNVAKRELKGAASSVYPWSSFATSPSSSSSSSSSASTALLSSSSIAPTTATHDSKQQKQQQKQHTIGNSYSNEHHLHPLKLQTEAIANWNCDRCNKPLAGGPLYACKQCQHYIHRRCFDKRPSKACIKAAAASSSSAVASSSLSSSTSSSSSSTTTKKAETFACRPCAVSFASLNALFQHQQAKEHWFCPACDRKALQDGAALKNHMVQKHSDQYQFESSSSSDDDDDDDDDDEDEQWECPGCDQEFEHEHSLRQHQEAKQHWVVCRLCNREFVDADAFEAHKRDKHGSSSPFDASQDQQFLRSISVASLRAQLDSLGISYKNVNEKEELVRLLLSAIHKNLRK